MANTMVERSPWWVPWLFLLLVAGLWFWTKNATDVRLDAANDARAQLREAMVEACERVNVLRVESNQQAEVLREFLLAAGDTRGAAAELATDPASARINRTAAERYRAMADLVEPVEIPDCDEVIPDATVVQAMADL